MSETENKGNTEETEKEITEKEITEKEIEKKEEGEENDQKEKSNVKPDKTENSARSQVNDESEPM